MGLRAVGVAVVAALSVLGAGARAAPARPQHVMSIMQCADQYVLMLLPAERISSVSYLAEAGAPTPALAAKARRTRINHGLAEEIAAQKPDLIVAGAFTSPAARALAKKAGAPLIELGPADSFEAIRRQTIELGRAFGEPQRAQALISQSDATLAQLARTAPARRMVAVGWNGSGRAPGRGSLFDAILTAAGATNAAAGPGVFERSFDLEQLLAARPQPDLLLSERVAIRTRGRRSEQARHPVLLKAYGRRWITYPEAAYACGLPQSADAAAALRRAMLAAVSSPRPSP